MLATSTFQLIVALGGILSNCHVLYSLAEYENLGNMMRKSFVLKGYARLDLERKSARLAFLDHLTRDRRVARR